MRYHISSLARAKSLAHDVMSLVLEIADRRVPYTVAQHTIALVSGYDSWAELKVVLQKGHQGLTTLDETLEMEFLRERLRMQTGILADALELEKEHAALVIAHLRVSAHPAGPHRLQGPCSLLDVGGVPREYRGDHADGRPIVLVAGCERSVSIAGVAIGHGRDDKAVPPVVLDVGPLEGEVRLRGGVVSWVRHRESSVPRHLQVTVAPIPDLDDLVFEESQPYISRGPDLSIFEDEHHIGIVAREPDGHSGMRAIRVKIQKGSNPGFIQASSKFMLREEAEQAFKADQLGPEDPVRSLNSKKLDFLDCLIRCGLIEESCKDRHLGVIPIPADRRPEDLTRAEESERHWKAIVAHTDLKRIFSVLDYDAVKLLRSTSRDLLRDESVYNRVRKVANNSVARESLERLPILFEIIYASPELMKLGDFSSVRGAIISDGATCSDLSGREPVAPIPPHVFDWMVDLDFRFEVQESAFVNRCVEALSILSSKQLSRTVSEWQALQFLVRELGAAVENPAQVLGVEAVSKFMRAQPLARSNGRRVEPLARTPNRPASASA
jgi:hypothetical protein